MEKLIAYHGEPGIKDQYLARVMEHRRLDHLTQGVGWESNGHTRGCAVGCTLEAYDHKLYPIELGVPEVLAHLEDKLFELQTPKNAQTWPERFLDAIPVGADLSKVWPQWAIWMLTDPQHGVIQYAKGHADATAAIEQVADCYRRGATQAEFEKAAARADAAADAAAWASAARAARAAADAAWVAAWVEASYAGNAAAARAAEAWTNAACDKLIELLKAAP